MSIKQKNAGTKKQTLPELTDAEWVIMKVVWENQPCAAGTVQENLPPSKEWAYSTVKTTMDRMVQKGLLEVKRIRNLQLFSSRINKKKARHNELQKMLKRAFDGTIAPMMQHLLKNEKLSKKDLDKLREIVKAAGKQKK